eukprot:COSAG06_NODE_8558_length_2130_cov_2.142787_3_plen_109_part_00
MNPAVVDQTVHLVLRERPIVVLVKKCGVLPILCHRLTRTLSAAESAQRTAMGCHEADVAVDVAVDEGQAFRPFRYFVSFESKGRDSATMVERKARNLRNRVYAARAEF